MCCSEGGRNSKCKRAMLVHNPIYNRLSKDVTILYVHTDKKANV